MIGTHGRHRSDWGLVFSPPSESHGCKTVSPHCQSGCEAYFFFCGCRFLNSLRHAESIVSVARYRLSQFHCPTPNSPNWSVSTPSLTPFLPPTLKPESSCPRSFHAILCDSTDQYPVNVGGIVIKGPTLMVFSAICARSKYCLAAARLYSFALLSEGRIHSLVSRRGGR